MDDLRARYSGYLKEAGCRTALQVIPAEALADLPRDGLYLDRGYLPPEMADAAFERMTAGLPAFHFEGSTCVMDTEAADPAGGSAALPVIMNRKASHLYFVDETFEVGIMLIGSEVKL